VGGRGEVLIKWYWVSVYCVPGCEYRGGGWGGGALLQETEGTIYEDTSALLRTPSIIVQDHGVRSMRPSQTQRHAVCRMATGPQWMMQL
jgi:hypothetical protein